MANIKSAQKRMRQNEKRRERNRAARTRMRTAVKRVRRALDEGDVEAAEELLPEAIRVTDTAVGKGVVHRNKAARTKSRLIRAIRRAKGEENTESDES
ncbi:MAG: 30S ribosomal protein S20 [Thermoanaerobaculia bacterium]|nr:30S ribosomal protein S20 [Thermoanaerobaculia bacterium]